MLNVLYFAAVLVVIVAVALYNKVDDDGGESRIALLGCSRRIYYNEVYIGCKINLDIKETERKRRRREKKRMRLYKRREEKKEINLYKREGDIIILAEVFFYFVFYCYCLIMYTNNRFYNSYGKRERGKKIAFSRFFLSFSQPHDLLDSIFVYIAA